ncbi:DUF4974 domain-containing protein [Nibribacter ruber]|uniref:DUF4974 domain-containing protein n=1 Tax=Nibribacter ruber TaxID=2698458 RepID=A0A6P1NXN7_9BACT|nr:FecR domain-containing protein [Nibribacter ruber]QHL86635.1 DUF4974 domain-containing protein [Nibribacter ruber]
MTQTTPVNHESPEWVLMAKALRGELNDEEQKEFSAWLAQEESHAQQWTDALETWQRVGLEQHSAFEPDARAAWQKVCAKANIHTPVIPAVEAQEAVVLPMFNWSSLAKFAAVFVLAAGLAWLGYSRFGGSEEWTQVATLTGERKVFYLPDSSRVVLNENSTLRYLASFEGDERKVELTGEGFFEVQKNPSKPFLITSGDAQTKVLGTSFNVWALKDEKEVAVTVSTGKVSFSSLQTQNNVILTPGFTGRLNANGQVEKQLTEEALAPTWQTLTFKGTTLGQMEKTLEAYFGVDITLNNNTLQHCTFTGTFNHPHLKEVLAVLAASNGFTVLQPTANNYIISGDGCQ